MTEGSLADYRILVLDEKTGPGSWGALTQQELEEAGYTAIHKITVADALTEVANDYYDLLIVDMDLGGSENGIEFQKQIRALGLTQPVVFVTGNQNFLDSRIFEYTDAFSRGPVLFYDKNSNIELLDLVREATTLVDPIRRSLYLMKKAGLGEKQYEMGGERFTVNDLLIPNAKTIAFVRSLRESLQALMLEVEIDKE